MHARAEVPFERRAPLLLRLGTSCVAPMERPTGLEAAAATASAARQASRATFADKLRQQCLSRVRGAREELVARLRGQGPAQNHQGGAAGAVSALLHSIVASQVGGAFLPPAQPPHLPPLADGEAGMEEDGMWVRGRAAV